MVQCSARLNSFGQIDYETGRSLLSLSLLGFYLFFYFSPQSLSAAQSSPPPHWRNAERKAAGRGDRSHQGVIVMHCISRSPIHYLWPTQLQGGSSRRHFFIHFHSKSLCWKSVWLLYYFGQVVSLPIMPPEHTSSTWQFRSLEHRHVRMSWETAARAKLWGHARNHIFSGGFISLKKLLTARWRSG